MADALHVELVAADRTVWSGEAAMVIARTVEGDLGVLRGHTPVLSLLSEGVVEIQAADSSDGVTAAIDGGFISVAADRVSILAEHIALAEDIQVDEAQSDLESAREDSEDAEDAGKRIRYAEARIRAAEKVR